MHCSSDQTASANRARGCPYGRSTRPPPRTAGCLLHFARGHPLCRVTVLQSASTGHLEVAFASCLQLNQWVGRVFSTEMSTDSSLSSARGARVYLLKSRRHPHPRKCSSGIRDGLVSLQVVKELNKIPKGASLHLSHTIGVKMHDVIS